MLCLGIDSGTKSTKALVLDIESGAVLALAQETYGPIEGLPPGKGEQEPHTWREPAQKNSPEGPQTTGGRREGSVGAGGG